MIVSVDLLNILMCAGLMLVKGKDTILDPWGFGLKVFFLGLETEHLDLVVIVYVSC